MSDASGDAASSRRVEWVEWLVLAGVVVAGAVFTLAESRQMWFTADFWGLIADDPGGLPHLLELHAGHPSVLHTASAVAIAAVTDLGNAWPWAMLPRVVGWGVFLVVLWWVVRRRGADARVALAVMAVLTVYGATGWMMGWFLGSPVALGSVLVATWLTAEVEQPTWGQVVGLGGLLLAASSSSTTGLLGAVAVALVTVVSARSRRWWYAIGVAGALYAAWRALAPARTPGLGLDTEVLLELPMTALQIAQHGYARLLTVPVVYGWLVVAAVAAILLFLAVRRRLGAYEVTLLLWAALYLGAAITVRLAAGQASVQTIRYGYVLSIITLAAVLPWLRPPRGRAMTAGIVLVAALLSVRNAALLERGLQFWEDRSTASRLVVETAAALVANGEPFVPRASVDAPRAGMLTTTQLEELVSKGWIPRVHGEEAELAARGDLRVRARPMAVPDGAVCDVMTAGEFISAPPSSWVRLAGGSDGTVAVLSRDRYGDGRQELSAARHRSWSVTVAERTSITVDAPDGGALLCTSAG